MVKITLLFNLIENDEKSYIACAKNKYTMQNEFSNFYVTYILTDKRNPTLTWGGGGGGNP